MNDLPPGDPRRDRTLIRRMIDGDEPALAELYDAHAQTVYAVAAAVLGVGGDAEDAVTKTFVQVWERPEAYDGARGEVASWLRTIARSRALDIVRAEGRRQNRHAQAGRAARGWRPPGPETAALAGELHMRVAEAVAELPPEQQSVLELAYFEGLTQSEIAERLATPLGTVKTRVRAALGKLKGSLAAYSGWKQP